MKDVGWLVRVVDEDVADGLKVCRADDLERLLGQREVLEEESA